MSERKVLANQATIIANQRAIQRKLAMILANQSAIRSNQRKLDRITANQQAIIGNQKKILANQARLLKRR